jgi:hypothetical protein
MLHQSVHEESALGAVETGESFGSNRLSAGRIRAACLQPVSAHNEITPHAAIAGTTGDGRLKLEFWSANQQGQMTAAGWGSAAVR